MPHIFCLIIETAMRGDAFGTEYKSVDYGLLKRLIFYLKPYKKYVYIAIFLTLLTSALGPARPYLTKVTIDSYIATEDVGGLIWMIGALFGLIVLHGAIQFGMTYIMQWVGQNVLHDLRNKLFEHIQKLAMRFYDKNPVGRLVTRVTNDVEVLNQLFSSGFVMIIADIMLIFWLIAFMFYTNWQLALLTLAVLPILLAVTSIFRKKVRVLFRDIRLEVARMNSFLNEFITGISTIKLFAQEKKQLQKFDEINSRTRELHVKTIFYYAVFFPTVEMLSAVAIAIVLWFAAGNILSGMMTVGTLVAFIQYAEMFFRPVRDLSEKYTTMQSAMASSERIFGLLDNKDYAEDKPGAIELDEFRDKIEFKNLSFSYDEKKTVLKDINFEVNRGETVAIVGATGSGKSTLINLICRYYDYEHGDILLDGKSLKDIKIKSLRNKIALVMQDVFLFSRSINDNISMGDKSIGKEKIRDAARALGALEFIEKREGGFDNLLNERGQTLSAGQRQLISFCRAFVNDPELLILDEATSNIDTETEQIIERSLDKLLEGRTSIVIAHRLSTIKRASKIIVLHNGRVHETGTHDELIKLGGIYSRLYQLQFTGEEAPAV